MPRWPARTPLERFAEKWEEDADGCRIWTGATDPDGYGQFSVDGRTVQAHRWIFEQMTGILAPVVRHDCDKPACVHWERCLLPGTQGDNNADRDAKNRVAHGEANGMAVLTNQQVAEIRLADLEDSGSSRAALARQYGISYMHVWSIVTGRTRTRELL